MSFFRGPKIVTSGLVVYLDAGNTKSYPTSGTAWSDLSESNNNGVLTNSPTFNSNNSGNIVFDGTNKRAELSTPFGKGDYTTVSAWYKRDELNSSSSWRTILATTSTNIHHLISADITRIMGIWDGGFKSFTYTPLDDGKFHNYVVIYQSGLNASLYVDGVFIINITTTLDLQTSPIGSIGNWSSGNYWAGNISNIKIYNRELTASEILQNYNALKSRFGH